MSALSSAQQQRLDSILRAGETTLLAAPCGAALSQQVSLAPAKGSFLARLFGRKNQPTVPTAVGTSFFAITNKRVMVFADAAAEPREWFLMLGLIQEFLLKPDASGDIIFDYELTEEGGRTPQGILSVAQAQHVHDTLASAIDAAYNASPWSV